MWVCLSDLISTSGRGLGFPRGVLCACMPGVHVYGFDETMLSSAFQVPAENTGCMCFCSSPSVSTSCANVAFRPVYASTCLKVSAWRSASSFMYYIPLHVFAPVCICVGVCIHEYLCVSVSLQESQEINILNSRSRRNIGFLGSSIPSLPLLTHSPFQSETYSKGS